MAKLDKDKTDLTENQTAEKKSSTCGKDLSDNNSFEIVTSNSRSEPVVFKPELSWPHITLQIFDETSSSENGRSTNAMAIQSGQHNRRFRGVRKRFSRVANIWHSVRSKRYEDKDFVAEPGEQKETNGKPLKSRIATAVSNFKNKHFTKDAVVKSVACSYGVESDGDDYYTTTPELTGFSNPNYQEQEGLKVTVEE